MWNILCDAIAERREYYGFTGGTMVAKIYPPYRKVDLPFNAMRNAIFDLVNVSCNVFDFGRFAPLHYVSGGYLGHQHPYGEFYEKLGVDGYALFLDRLGLYEPLPPVLPALRRRAGDFLNTAAKIINDFIRYPEPVFGMQASFSARDFVSGETFRGQYPDQPLPEIENDNGVLFWTAEYLACWQKSVAKAENTNHKLRYPGSRTVITNRSKEYQLTELTGSVPVRYTFKVIGQKDGIVIDSETIENNLTLNCSANVTENISFGSWRSKADAVWGMDAEETEYTLDAVYIDPFSSSQEFLFREENFNPLPYKYLE